MVAPSASTPTASATRFHPTYEAQSHGSRTRCLRLVAKVTRGDARLASGHDHAPVEIFTPGPIAKFRSFSGTSSSPRLAWRTGVFGGEIYKWIVHTHVPLPLHGVVIPMLSHSSDAQHATLAEHCCPTLLHIVPFD